MTTPREDPNQANSFDGGPSHSEQAANQPAESSPRRRHRWTIVAVVAVGVMVLILFAQMLTTPAKPVIKGTPPAPAPLPPATVKRLQALGYLRTPPPPPTAKPKASTQPSPQTPPENEKPARNAQDK